MEVAQWGDSLAVHPGDWILNPWYLHVNTRAVMVFVILILGRQRQCISRTSWLDQSALGQPRNTVSINRKRWRRTFTVNASTHSLTHTQYTKNVKKMYQLEAGLLH